MIVDTSAILAIFLDEPEKDDFLTRILLAEGAAISAANFLETCLKVDRSANEIARHAFDEFFEKLGLEVAPVSLAQTQIARRANQLYGRGSGSLARLNFGDCFAYALAKERGLPLLFKGDDFAHTDIQRPRGT